MTGESYCGSFEDSKNSRKNWCTWSETEWRDSNSREFRMNNFQWIRGIMKRNMSLNNENESREENDSRLEGSRSASSANLVIPVAAGPGECRGRREWRPRSRTGVPPAAPSDPRRSLPGSGSSGSRHRTPRSRSRARPRPPMRSLRTGLRESSRRWAPVRAVPVRVMRICWYRSGSVLPCVAKWFAGVVRKGSSPLEDCS